MDNISKKQQWYMVGITALVVAIIAAVEYFKPKQVIDNRLLSEKDNSIDDKLRVQETPQTNVEIIQYTPLPRTSFPSNPSTPTTPSNPPTTPGTKTPKKPIPPLPRSTPSGTVTYPIKDFEYLDLKDGSKKRLYPLLDAGKKVFIMAYTSWCGRCTTDMPKVRALQDKINAKNSNIQIVMVSCDKTMAPPIEKVKKANLWDSQIIHLLSPEGSANNILSLIGGFGYPTYLLVDKTAKIEIDPDKVIV